jgi:hypothetical protein
VFNYDRIMKDKLKRKLFITTLPVADGRSVSRPDFSTPKQTNSVAFSPQANYIDRATAITWRNLVATFADTEVSRGQRGGSRTVVNVSFLDQSRCCPFKWLLIYPHKG